MPSNVEIKAKASDPAVLRERADSLADGPAVRIDQDDTFFCVPKGRLKLRCFADGRGELIYYERDDSAGPKESRYHIYETSDPEGLRGALVGALGVRGRVRKTRLLYMVNQTRIHLDAVEGLGDFLELEVVLTHDQSPEDGAAIAQDLMSRLGVASGELVQGAYVDLLDR